MNPYRGLPDYQFWSSAMTMSAPTDIDPVIYGDFQILRNDKISTLGSCFAQHVARWVSNSGFGYFVAERPPDDMPEEIARYRNYGVFSARYGNIYTVRQGLQLFQRAFDEFTPVDKSWVGKTGFVDPFRPQIEPDEFTSIEELLYSRECHLHAARRVFLESDVIIFTLGLTEGWQSRRDGAVFPMAPGVSGGEYQSENYAFVNFGVQSVIADLEEFSARIKSVNHRAKIILTVSPVPLIATYEKRHVLVSTVVSKSILRVAADEIVKTNRNITYFPSFEIITNPGLIGGYYAADLREVTPLGVGHVMRLFDKHFLSTEKVAREVSHQSSGQKIQSNIICDEEVIERTLSTKNN